MPNEHGDVPSVSVVMATYLRRDGLQRVIRPLLDDQATMEVVVVVDGGADGSWELLKEWSRRDPRVRPIMAEHGGQAAAQQRGVDAASGDVVLLVDDDVVAGPGLVSGHAGHHRDRHDLVVVGYMPVAAAAPRASSEWVVRSYAARYAGNVGRWRAQPDRILLKLWGGNVSIRRSNLERIPIQLPGAEVRYHVDLEFGMRCWKAGLSGVFDPTLEAAHEYRRSVGQFLRDRAVSAGDRAVIHRLHEDLVGPLPDDFFRSDRRLPTRLLLRSVGRGSPFVEQTFERLLGVDLVANNARVGAWAADFLARARSQRIVREVRAGTGAGPDGRAGGLSVRGGR